MQEGNGKNLLDLHCFLLSCIHSLIHYKCVLSISSGLKSYAYTDNETINKLQTSNFYTRQPLVMNINSTSAWVATHSKINNIISEIVLQLDP